MMIVSPWNNLVVFTYCFSIGPWYKSPHCRQVYAQVVEQLLRDHLAIPLLPVTTGGAS